MTDSSVQTQPRRVGWSDHIAALVLGFILAGTVSGLAILWMPFSVANQWNVIVHTVVGLVLVPPTIWFVASHWRAYSEDPLSHVKLTGYFTVATILLLVVSGVALTVQAAFGTRISYAWDVVHIVATFGCLAAIAPHLIPLVVRSVRGRSDEAADLRSGQGAYFRRATLWMVGSFVPLAILVGVYDEPDLDNRLPEDYSFLYGEDRPFAPSLARTVTNQAYDPRSMSGSQSCGTAGCHEQILEEWQVSAHRYSTLDPAFRAIQAVMGEQNGPESTRYCAGCHDPISLFAGTKNLFVDELTTQYGMDEGVSCITCHSIQETDVQGNANYVIEQPVRYVYELEPEGRGRLVRDFLIRAYPDQHKESFSKRLFKSPEYCAACHKQFVDEEVNQVGWVQLQNQFDNWKNSRWNEPGDPEKTIECRECHMPLTESRDPASGDELDYNRTADDGRHRSHRFLGANQAVPLWLELPGASEHVELTRKWLRGEIEIPEIAHKWLEGPVIPIEIEAPERVAAGEEITIRTHLTNNKAGHEFPTGPLDIIQAWVEITVTDQNGRVVYQSGHLDENRFIEPGSFIYKAEPVDRYGNLVDRHNLWKMVGVRFRRSLFPGFSDLAEFTFLCPASVLEPPEDAGSRLGDEAVRVRVAEGGTVERLDVTARLLYRKFDQFLLNFLAGGPSELTAPVTVMSEDRATIEVMRTDGL